jgi:hypothetical protein
MEKRLDHKKYGSHPDYYINRLLISQLINVDQTFENYMYIAKNEWEILDHWYPWANKYSGGFYSVD